MILNEIKMSPEMNKKFIASNGNLLLCGFELEIIVPTSIRHKYDNSPYLVAGATRKKFESVAIPEKALQNIKNFETFINKYGLCMSNTTDANSLDVLSAKLKHCKFKNLFDLLNQVNYPSTIIVYDSFFGDKTFRELVKMSGIFDLVKDATGMNVKISNTYHGLAKERNIFYIEPDYSIIRERKTDLCMEIVSPPLAVQATKDHLSELIDKLTQYGAYFNGSCGLHIGLSMSTKNIDLLKFILFFGDTYILQLFNREYNAACRSIVDQLKQNRDVLNDDMLKKLRNMSLHMINNEHLCDVMSNHGASINLSHYIDNGYIEVRSMGGNIQKKLNSVFSSIDRLARAYMLASDTSAAQSEYAKKIYKLLHSS